ncbi:hypothetical protein JCM9279_007675 [Rhodotorula babjevae]
MLPLSRDMRYGRISTPSPRGDPSLDSDEDSGDDEDERRLDWRRAFDAEPPAVKMLTTAFIRAIPLAAALSWLATLLALLGLWTFQDGRKRYLSSNGSVSSIASIGAAHRLTFIFGSISTAVFYILSLVTERFLRMTRVLTEASEERYLWIAVGIVDVHVGILAGASLILLAVFDTVEFPHEHDVLLIAFFVCVIVSGLLQTTEVEHLWHEHPDRHDLREGAFLKACFLTSTAIGGLGYWILTTLCGGDATAVPYERCYRLVTAAATCQWLAAFSVAAYLSTLVLDLWPVARHSPRAHPRARADRSGVRALWVGGEGGRWIGEVEEDGREGARSARGRLEVPHGWTVSRPHGGGASVLPPVHPPTVDDGSDDGRRERAELLVELGRAGKRAARRKGGRARR